MDYSKDIQVLKETVDNSRTQDVEIHSLVQEKQLYRQLGNSIEDIQKTVLASANISVYPQSFEGGTVLALVKERLQELSTEGQIGLAYIGSSLAVTVNIQTEYHKPDDILFDIIVIREKHPATVCSVIKSSTESMKPAQRYNASLSKSVTRTIRAFTSETFITVHGILAESDLISITEFKGRLDTIVKQTSRLCIPDALSMSREKYQAITRAFLSSIASLSFVDLDNSEEATWFLTLQQFCVLTENIDRHDVHVYAAPSSGEGVLSLAVLQRLEKKGKTILIADDPKLLELARKNKMHAVSECHFQSEGMKFEMEGVFNIIISCIPDTNKRLRSQLPETKALWIFDRLEANAIVGSMYGVQQEPLLQQTESVLDKKMALKDSVDNGQHKECSQSDHGRRSSKHFTVDIARVQIAERTTRELEDICSGAIKTSSFYLTLDKLRRSGSVTVIGSPGDGKTTLGYLILKEMQDADWTPLRIRFPDEYFTSVPFEREVIMIEAIFGFETFDKTTYERWLPVLTDITQQMNRKPKKYDRHLCVLITSNDYIYHEAMQGRSDSFLTRNLCNISVDSPLSYEEKQHIIQSKENIYGIHVKETDVQEVCQSELPFGFPSSCNVFFQSQNAPEDFVTYMKFPSSFLIPIVHSFLSDKGKRRLLFLLVQEKGKLDIAKYDLPLLEEGGFQNLDMRRQVVILDGLLLKRCKNTVRFTHQAVHVATALGLAYIDPKRCISNTKLSVLDHIIQIGENLSSTDDKLFINDDLRPLLVQRLHESIGQEKMYSSLSMRAFCDATIVTEVLSKFVDIPALLKKTDKKKKMPFSYFVSSNGGTTLLTKLLSLRGFVNLVQAVRGCCEYDNVAALKLLLTRCPRLAQETSDAMHICCTNDNHLICALLLKHGAEVNTTDKEQNTAIHTCAVNGSTKCLKEMLAFCEELPWNEINQYGKSSLHLALENDYDSTAFILLDHVDCDIQDRDGRTALHIACETGLQFGIISALALKTEDIALCDGKGNTSIHAAVSSGNMKTIQEILEVVDVHTLNIGNKTGITPLQMIPVMSAAGECYDLLLRAGADPSVTDEEENNVLHIYSKTGNIILVSKILGKQDSLKNTRNRTGQTPLHIAAKYGKDIIVQCLLDAGADPLIKDEGNFTPLLYACIGGYLSVVKVLVIPSGLKYENGVLPLHESVSNGHSQIVEYLLDMGCSIDARNEGWTALHIATLWGHLNVVQVLLKRASSVNVKIESCEENVGIYATRYTGCTALHIASMYDHVSIAEELLNTGCDVSIKDKKDKTARCYAKISEMHSTLSFQEFINKTNFY